MEELLLNAPVAVGAVVGLILTVRYFLKHLSEERQAADVRNNAQLEVLSQISGSCHQHQKDQADKYTKTITHLESVLNDNTSALKDNTRVMVRAEKTLEDIERDLRPLRQGEST